MSHKSTFLFADPSLLNGTAYMLDFYGTYNAYNRSRTPLEADTRALYTDWRSVGEALVQAINQAWAEKREQTI